mmetsp:Transcript_5147/g.10892  ORF Transcript_5147/g.10892 Transcript_5147/m.10892 type:complete len:308 (-) Transcript_5147:35-958(-)
MTPNVLYDLSTQAVRHIRCHPCFCLHNQGRPGSTDTHQQKGHGMPVSSGGGITPFTFIMMTFQLIFFGQNVAIEIFTSFFIGMKGQFGRGIQRIFLTRIVHRFQNAEIIGTSRRTSGTTTIAHQFVVGIIATPIVTNDGRTFGQIGIDQSNNLTRLAGIFVNVQGGFDFFGNVAAQTVIVMSLDDSKLSFANGGRTIRVTIIGLQQGKCGLHDIFGGAVDRKAQLFSEASTSFMVFFRSLNPSQGKEQGSTGQSLEHHGGCLFDLVGVDFVNLFQIMRERESLSTVFFVFQTGFGKIRSIFFSRDRY